MKKHIHSFWNCLEYGITMGRNFFNFCISQVDPIFGYTGRIQNSHLKVHVLYIVYES